MNTEAIETLLDTLQEVADTTTTEPEPTSHIKGVTSNIGSEEDLIKLSTDDGELQTLIDQAWSTVQNSAEQNYQPGYEFRDYPGITEPTESGNPRYIYHSDSDTFLAVDVYFSGVYKLRFLFNLWAVRK